MDGLALSSQQKISDSELVPNLDMGVDVTWVDVCAQDELIPGTGVAALVKGEQIALFCTRARALYAISNYDPFSHAFVIARGIIGDRGGVPKVASPIYKQNFDLSSGRCLDDPNVTLPVYPVRARGGRVEIGVRTEAR
ncbi:MAG TPA: nitrite reductase small subunit NirD [Polyangiaceae bacterium]|nr:nitrite reductase small subunit NirD [Polyangiaceae bacterium]